MKVGTNKRKPGRPRTGRGVQVGVTIPRAVLKRVDVYCFDAGIAKRQAAIRDLILRGLDRK